MFDESNTENSAQVDVLYRKLTLIDVDQALYTLEFNQESSLKRALPLDDESETMLHKQERDCCRLRQFASSSRPSLPLARRGRPHFSTRPHRFLCSNCTEIKRQQQLEILQNQQTIGSNRMLQIIINLGLSAAEQTALNNHQYQSDQMFVWKINTTDEKTIDLSYDTDSLMENEKKVLLEETIRKLQVILNNRSTTTTTTDIEQDNIELTYRALQTTMNILSSSHNSV